MGQVSRRRNIVLVVVDALRADHLGSYGYRRDTSPNIDRLADEGVRFTRAYSHGNRTIIAMPSLFTSLYPAYHGAVGFHEYVTPLPDDRVTMAETLQDNGYTTVGLMSNVYLKHPFGLTQGFDVVEEFNTARFSLSLYRVIETLGLVTLPDYKVDTAPAAVDVTDQAIAWMDRAGDEPFFLFAHYMDVHHPYTPPAADFNEFDRGTSDMDENTLFMMTAALVRHQPPLPLRTGELHRLEDLYDACIRHTDTEIGRLISAVELLPDDRDTYIIFTSDHGDEFLEHGSLYHNNVLIEELIRVPLIVWKRGSVDGRVENALVRHIDVMPTVVELAGGEMPVTAMGAVARVVAPWREKFLAPIIQFQKATIVPP